MNGLLKYRDGMWGVGHLKPHVAMRFKDVFKGIPFGSTPPFQLRDRLDIATDLDWFMQRYPLDMDQHTRQALDERLYLHAEQQRAVTQILTQRYEPSLVTGFRPGEAPEPYQLRAADLFKETGRLLLMDDVGLGKTVSFLASIADGWGLPAAVVVQPHLSTQWVKQYIERFTHLKAIEVTKTRPHKLQSADMYVFRYTNIAGWVDYFGQMRPLNAARISCAFPAAADL